MFFVLRSRFDRMKKWADESHTAYLDTTNKMVGLLHENAALKEALRAIIASKTARPNGTVARIIKLAEEALGEEVQNEEGSTRP